MILRTACLPLSDNRSRLSADTASWEGLSTDAESVDPEEEPPRYTKGNLLVEEEDCRDEDRQFECVANAEAEAFKSRQNVLVNWNFIVRYGSLVQHFDVLNNCQDDEGERILDTLNFWNDFSMLCLHFPARLPAVRTSIWSSVSESLV
jgi:hypothetical protein